MFLCDELAQRENQVVRNLDERVGRVPSAAAGLRPEAAFSPQACAWVV